MWGPCASAVGLAQCRYHTVNRIVVGVTGAPQGHGEEDKREATLAPFGGWRHGPCSVLSLQGRHRDRTPKFNGGSNVALSGSNRSDGGAVVIEEGCEGGEQT